MLELNKIYNMDCIDGLKQLDDNCIDLVVTSPPYNVDLGNNKYNKNPYNLYNDNKEHDEYIGWLKDIFAECERVLKEGARICINVGDGKNGAVSTHSDIIQMMTHGIGYIPMATIVWRKCQVAGRTAWGSFNSPSCPSFPTPFEYILVFAKGDRKLQEKGETDLDKEEFVKWAYGEWTFAPESKQKVYGHPAMFPEELPKRCIKMFSWIGATVLDPLSGAGTTAVVAKKLNRNYIGFEISPEYIKIAEDRLNGVV